MVRPSLTSSEARTTSSGQPTEFQAMGSRLIRSLSPGRHGSTARSSTGDLDVRGYESYYHYPRSSRESVVPGPRSSGDRLVGSRTSAPRTYRETLPLRKYAEGERGESSRTSYADTDSSQRRPISVISGPISPSRLRSGVSSTFERSSHPQSRSRADESVYIYPSSSSHHHRHSSVGNSSMQRYQPRYTDRSGPGYAGLRGSGQSQYQLSRRDEAIDGEGYEYTSMRDQAYRDTAPRPRMRRTSDVGVRERPHSITGLDDYRSRGSASGRFGGPPVSTRGLSKIQQDGTVRHEYRYPRDGGGGSQESSQARSEHENREARHKHSQAPVSLHHSHNSYGSSTENPRREAHKLTSRRKEDLEERDGHGLGISIADKESRKADDHGHRRREDRSDSQDRYTQHHSRHGRDDSADHHHRRRDSKSHRSVDEDTDKHRKQRDEVRREKYEDSKTGEGAALGAAGAAALGLLSGSGKSRRSNQSSEAGSDNSNREAPHRYDNRLAVIDHSDTSSRSGDTDEEKYRRRKDRKRENIWDGSGREGKLRIPREEETRPSSHDRDAERDRDRDRDRDRGYDRDRKHRGSTDSRAETRTSGRRPSEQGSRASEEEDDRAPRDYKPSEIRVVSPPKEPPPKPKGILRKPRDKFPEDPAPIREGVAPLKDAGKKGIPPNARWTKIDRRLVNPEALEQGNERFEERAEYVIVLRVLSKEEIQQYAQRTAEIRESRDLEYERGSSREIEELEQRLLEDEKEPPKMIADRANSGEGATRSSAANEQYQPNARSGSLQPPPGPPAMAASAETLPVPGDADRPSYYPSISFERQAPPSLAQRGNSYPKSQPPAQGPPPPIQGVPYGSVPDLTAPTAPAAPPAAQMPAEPYPPYSQGYQPNNAQAPLLPSAMPPPPNQYGTGQSEMRVT